MARMTRKRSFELGALAMQKLAMAKCVNLNESLLEGIMTDAGLTAAEKVAMNHQVAAIDVALKDIESESPGAAAYYGSYILGDREQAEIKAPFPDVGPRFEI